MNFLESYLEIEKARFEERLAYSVDVDAEIRSLIDDEREARRRLARLLGEHVNEIEVTGEAADGPSAVEAIQKLEPDLLFLDIDMPGLYGFGVLDSLSHDEWPIVVFTTASRAR